jgi:flavin-dependent dehydrogenase
MINTDVLIVGGGPAGSSCAWHLERAGFDCLILDKALFPREKPCAGWITPAVFGHLGISLEEYPHSLTKFTSFQISLRGIKFQIPTKQYAIRRLEFDHWLLKRAGVQHTQHKVERIEVQNGLYILDGEFSGKFLVGAGGTHCPVRKTIFDEQNRSRNKALIIAKEAEFAYPAKDNRCHLWFFEHGLPGYAWYVPKRDGCINIGIGGSAAGLKKLGETLNQHWQRLIVKLEKMGLVNDYDVKPLGYSYYRRHRFEEPCRENAYLVGDALGIATQDMGEGISPAIHSGLLAGEAIASGQDYSIRSIPKYSFPSILQLRK